MRKKTDLNINKLPVSVVLLQQSHSCYIFSMCQMIKKNILYTL